METSNELPGIGSLRGLAKDDQIRALDLLFEASPDIHDMLVPQMESASFKSYNDFISACQASFESLLASAAPASQQRAKLHSILGSHPRLGAEKVESSQSASEQAKLQAGDPAQLAALNAEYEAKFPGLRYVVFVNGRGRPEIMDDMRRRITRGDMALEEQEGIQAMCDIAKDRASKLQG